MFPFIYVLDCVTKVKFTIHAFLLPTINHALHMRVIITLDSQSRLIVCLNTYLVISLINHKIHLFDLCLFLFSLFFFDNWCFVLFFVAPAPPFCSSPTHS